MTTVPTTATTMPMTTTPTTIIASLSVKNDEQSSNKESKPDASAPSLTSSIDEGKSLDEKKEIHQTVDKRDGDNDEIKIKDIDATRCEKSKETLSVETVKTVMNSDNSNHDLDLGVMKQNLDSRTLVTDNENESKKNVFSGLSFKKDLCGGTSLKNDDDDDDAVMSNTPKKDDVTDVESSGISS